MGWEVSKRYRGGGGGAARWSGLWAARIEGR